jgi:O-antigen ligase
VVTPLVFLPGALDAFRQPQRVVGEWLALASLLPLALAARPERPWQSLLRSPAFVAVAPLLLLATLSLATTSHPLHVREALADLWIGAAALVGWTLGFSAGRLRRLLDLAVVPAVGLATLGILQLHDLWRPLVLEPQEGERRLAVTSLLGNPGDLGNFLVLPCLLAQAAIVRPGRYRWAWALAGALCFYALAGTQTLTALGALAAGSLVFWLLLVPPRRAVALVGAGAVGLTLLVLVAAPLRERAERSVAAVREGRLNHALTGRLDGWRVAGRLFAEHPLAGVGHGAYRAEFTATKLALIAEGVEFYPGHVNPTFVNAHNELLEVGADLGWPGILALVAGSGVLFRAVWRLRRVGSAEAAFGWAGLLAVASIAMAQFPFRLGASAFPWIAFFAWALATSAAVAEEGGAT